MQAIVGGNQRYPTLQEICDLFRSSINDTGNNTTGSGVGTGSSAGVIMPNSNPNLLTILNGACKDVFAELRTVGDPELILDNWILTGLPPINSSYGTGVPNPAAQCALAYSGFFDGVQWYSQWTLPIGMSRILAASQRQSGTDDDFSPLNRLPAGLPGKLQGLVMDGYEMRQGVMWMSGATQPVDIRIRCRITFPSFTGSNIDFSTAYVPILDSANAIEAKMRKRYATRFAPEMKADAVADDKEFMGKLRLEGIRERQSAENQRAGFGDEAVADFAVAWSWL